MARERIELTELTELLNRQLRERTGEAGLRFEGEIERLAQPSPSGLNWSADRLHVPERYQGDAARILAEALRRYNLSD